MRAPEPAPRNLSAHRFGRFSGQLNRKLTSGSSAERSPAAVIETRRAAAPASVAAVARAVIGTHFHKLEPLTGYSGVCRPSSR
jgi:hypothetical protein